MCSLNRTEDLFHNKSSNGPVYQLEKYVNNFPTHLSCGHGADFSAETWIILVLIPVFLLLGLTGNILSILVMCRKGFKTTSTSVFIIILASCDIIYLLTNSLTNQWIDAVACVNIQKLSNVSCKTLKYLIYTSKFNGACILVSIAAERYIVVVYPFKAKTLCTLRNTKVYACILTLCTLTINSYVPVFMTNTPLSATYCHIDARVSDAAHVALNMLDLVLYSFVPSVLITVLNIGLCYRLNQRRKAVPALVSFSKALIQEDSLRLNVTLILISITFLVCTVPFAILLVFNSIPGNMDDSAESRVIFSSLYCLNLVNSAVNFLMYCVSGPKFRAEIRKMLTEIWGVCMRKNTVGQHPLTHLHSLRAPRTEGVKGKVDHLQGLSMMA